MAQRKHLAAIAGAQPVKARGQTTTRAQAKPGNHPPSVGMALLRSAPTPSPTRGEGRTKELSFPISANIQVREDADHFITRDGVTFAGQHLIIDLWEAEGLDDQARIETALRKAVEAAGATLLHIHLHTFTPNGGVSGVAVLAESHISVHTWPEKGYAAFDVFMCGDAEPKKALKVLERAFAPKRTVVGVHKRGVL
jgi:S-adenosylmethionine decarboxylase